MVWRLFLLFLKLGFISIGGGYPLMGMLLQEGSAAVGLTAAEFADLAALELLASGPIAINAATYIGYIKAGLPGALAATAGVCVSPFVLTTVLYYFLSRFRENRLVQGFIGAIKISCGGILLATALLLAHNILLFGNNLPAILAAPATGVQWGGVLIFGLCTLALLRFKANPIAVILGAGVVGAFLLA